VSELAVAVLLPAAILAASTISVELGISVALIELALGVVVGNAFDTGIPDWLSFIGTFAGIVLTFLAGAEVDVPQSKREWKAAAARKRLLRGALHGRDGVRLLGAGLVR
jgi:Kef-type K+ transport system membrane component KefB